MKYPYKDLENFTLSALLERSIKLYKDKPSLSYVGEEKMNYEEFGDKIQTTSKLLQDNDIDKGDKVILLSENMPNWGIAYFAITYLGAVVVPILPDFHPSDIHQILRHSEAKAVFVSNKYQTIIEDYDDSNINFVINIDTLGIVDELTNKSYFSIIKEKTKEMAQIITKNKKIKKVDENDLAAIIYTSGTTGHSKGVMLSHKNITTNALSTFSKVKITNHDLFLSILPLAHTLECTVGLIVPILHGASVEYIKKVPTPSVLLKAFKISKPTMMLSVPLIMEKIYKNKVLPNFQGSAVTKFIYSIPFFRKRLNKIAGKKLIETFGGRMRFFGIGGAPLSPYVEQFLIEADFPYIIGYGLTETSPLIAGGIIGTKQKLNSTGTAFFGVDIKIKNINPTTGKGEIIVRSPSVMLGYHKDKEKTDEVMDGEWFLTGDLGYIDEDGYLFISGRSKNVIIGSSGENIYPEQIEATINQHKHVLDSLVLEQDKQLIARIHLDYEAIDKIFTGNNEKIREEITAYLEKMRLEVNSNLSSFSKIKKFTEQIEPFVKTPTKKIKRYLYID